MNVEQAKQYIKTIDGKRSWLCPKGYKRTYKQAKEIIRAETNRELKKMWKEIKIRDEKIKKERKEKRIAKKNAKKEEENRERNNRMTFFGGAKKEKKQVEKETVEVASEPFDINEISEFFNIKRPNPKYFEIPIEDRGKGKNRNIPMYIGDEDESIVIYDFLETWNSNEDNIPIEGNIKVEIQQEINGQWKTIEYTSNKLTTVMSFELRDVPKDVDADWFEGEAGIEGWTGDDPTSENNKLRLLGYNQFLSDVAIRSNNPIMRILVKYDVAKEIEPDEKPDRKLKEAINSHCVYSELKKELEYKIQTFDESECPIEVIIKNKETMDVFTNIWCSKYNLCSECKRKIPIGYYNEIMTILINNKNIKKYSDEYYESMKNINQKYKLRTIPIQFYGCNKMFTKIIKEKIQEDAIVDCCYETPCISHKRKIKEYKILMEKLNVLIIEDKPFPIDNNDEAQKIVNDLKVNIYFCDRLYKVDIKFESELRRILTWCFINTRYNHVESIKKLDDDGNINTFCQAVMGIASWEPKSIEYDDMIKLYEDNKETATALYRNNQLKQLTIPSGKYKVKYSNLDDNDDCFDKAIKRVAPFWKKTSIQTIDNPNYELSRISTLINGLCVFNTVITPNYAPGMLLHKSEILNKVNLDDDFIKYDIYIYEHVDSLKYTNIPLADILSIPINPVNQSLPIGIIKSADNNTLKYLIDSNISHKVDKIYRNEYINNMKGVFHEVDESCAYLTSIRTSPYSDEGFPSCMSTLVDYSDCPYANQDGLHTGKLRYHGEFCIYETDLSGVHPLLKPYIVKTGFVKNMCIYTRIALLTMRDLGIKFKILYGHISYGKFKLEFTEQEIFDMSQRVEHGNDLSRRIFQLKFGQWGASDKNQVLKMQGDKELCAFLKARYPNADISYYNDITNTNSKIGDINIKFFQESIWNHRHQFSVLVDYTASCVFAQLKNFVINNIPIAAIQTDAFFINTNISEETISKYLINDSFRIKSNIAKEFNSVDRVFCIPKSGIPFLKKNHESFINWVSKLVGPRVLITGPAGCGKTHNTLMQFAKTHHLVNFVGPSWSLITEKANSYSKKQPGHNFKVNPMTPYGLGINVLVERTIMNPNTKEFEGKFKTYKDCFDHPGITVYDEATMSIDTIFRGVMELFYDKENPDFSLYGQLIVLGDFGKNMYLFGDDEGCKNHLVYYQIAPRDINDQIRGKRLSHFEHIHYDKNYRFEEGDKLHDITRDLRQLITDRSIRGIKRGISDEERSNMGRFSEKIYMDILSKYYENGIVRHVNEDELHEIYQKNDVILVSSKQCKKCKGLDKKNQQCPKGKDCNMKCAYYTELLRDKDMMKYYVNKRTAKYYKGDILHEKIENSDEMLGFTVHSQQGKTISKENKLFISKHLLNQPQLLYTMLSRVQSIEQVYFIE